MSTRCIDGTVAIEGQDVSSDKIELRADDVSGERSNHSGRSHSECRPPPPAASSSDDKDVKANGKEEDNAAADKDSPGGSKAKVQSLKIMTPVPEKAPSVDADSSKLSHASSSTHSSAGSPPTPAPAGGALDAFPALDSVQYHPAKRRKQDTPGDAPVPQLTSPFLRVMAQWPDIQPTAGASARVRSVSGGEKGVGGGWSGGFMSRRPIGIPSPSGVPASLLSSNELLSIAATSASREWQTEEAWKEAEASKSGDPPGDGRDDPSDPVSSPFNAATTTTSLEGLLKSRSAGGIVGGNADHGSFRGGHMAGPSGLGPSYAASLPVRFSAASRLEQPCTGVSAQPPTKNKPKHVPDYFRLTEDKIHTMLRPIASKSKRDIIVKHYDVGIMGLRGVANCSQEDALDRYKARTTHLRDETFDRKIVGVSFKTQQKPWVLCPHPRCIVKANSCGKLCGLFKFLHPSPYADASKPLGLWHVSRALCEAHGHVLDSDHFISATFCPQQTYSRHTDMCLSEAYENDVDKLVLDRFVIFGDETCHVYAMAREKAVAMKDADRKAVTEVLYTVMKRLVETRLKQKAETWRHSFRPDKFRAA
eukprot:GHVU01191601.1.p1 GENE.GHVU01191601.1~~GHVU01191601.1.p1  ORF type:complete len:591 (+),score=58.30 GHVU01191601.1:93-1865(+)